MKIKKVAALCRRNKRVIIRKREGNMGGVVQYIGVGAANYCADGLPLLEKETVCAVLDVPREHRLEWDVQIAQVPDTMDFGDTADEQPLKASKYQIVVDGRTMQPLVGSDGVLWIDAKYLAPVEDIYDLRLTKRTMPDGMPYIAVKEGMMLMAIIMPMGISQETTGDLARLLAATETIGGGLDE